MYHPGTPISKPSNAALFLRVNRPIPTLRLDVINLNIALFFLFASDSNKNRNMTLFSKVNEEKSYSLLRKMQENIFYFSLLDIIVSGNDTSQSSEVIFTAILRMKLKQTTAENRVRKNQKIEDIIYYMNTQSLRPLLPLDFRLC